MLQNLDLDEAQEAWVEHIPKSQCFLGEVFLRVIDWRYVVSY